MSLRTLARNRVGRIYHRLRPYKHVENSRRGARLARALGFPSIDWDLQITSDGVIVVCHDNQPLRYGFHDPLHPLRSRDFKISEHTFAEVHRLVAVTHGRVYRIQRVETLLAYAAKLGLHVVLEPKSNHLFALDWPWQHIAAVAEDVGCTVSVYALPELGGAAHVAAARRAGFQAWLI